MSDNHPVSEEMHRRIQPLVELAKTGQLPAEWRASTADPDEALIAMLEVVNLHQCLWKDRTLSSIDDGHLWFLEHGLRSWLRAVEEAVELRARPGGSAQ